MGREGWRWVGRVRVGCGRVGYGRGGEVGGLYRRVVREVILVFLWEAVDYYSMILRITYLSRMEIVNIIMDI